MKQYTDKFEPIEFTEPEHRRFRDTRLFKGGSVPKNTTQTTKSEPWSGQQPYLQQIFAQAQQLYNNDRPQYYPGQQVASQTADTLAGQQAFRDAASGIGDMNQLAGQAAAFNLTDGRDPANNPYLQSAIQAAIRPAQQALTDTGGALSNIRSSAMASGAYGGTRQGIAEGLAQARFGQSALDTAASMSNAAYQSGQQQATTTLGLMPGLIQSAQVPGQMLSAVGAQNEGYQQALIEAAMNKWNFNENADRNALADYLQMVQGNFGGTATTTGPGPYRPSGLQTALGGAAQGAALGSMIPGLGPMGTIAGAIGGALLGLF